MNLNDSLSIENKSNYNENNNNLRNSNQSSSSSISNLGSKKNPRLKQTINLSSAILIMISLITFILAIKNNVSPLYGFSDDNTNTSSLFIRLSNICILISNLIIAGTNILLLKKLQDNKPSSFINLIHTLPKYNLAIVNILLSSMYILPFIILKSTFYYVICIIISILILLCILTYYKKLHLKKKLDVFSVITIKRYTSMILAIILYTLFFNIGKTITNIFPSTKSTTIITIIENLIQFLFGIVLISYYNDITFMCTSVVFIYIPKFIYSIDVDKQMVVVVDVIIYCMLGFIIIFWKLYKTKHSILGTERESSSKVKEELQIEMDAS